MRIDIAKIMTKADGCIDEMFDINIDTINFCGSDYIMKDDCQAHVVINNLGKSKISVSVDTTINLISSCSRCLQKVTFPVVIDYNEEIIIDSVTGKGNDGDNDEIGYIDEFLLDTDALILNEIYPCIPSNILCKEDCRGLCIVCGKDLNKGDCLCDRQVLNPGMAKILDVYNNFKEV